MVSFTYHPADGFDIWQRQLYNKTINMKSLDSNEGFEFQAPSVGTVRFFPDGTAVYDMDFEDFTFKARTEDCIMWSGVKDRPGKETSPEG
jgi:hypothetical protein